LTSRSAIILEEIERLLQGKYNIEHTTIQFECESCGDDLVEDNAPQGCNLKNHGHSF